MPSEAAQLIPSDGGLTAHKAVTLRAAFVRLKLFASHDPLPLPVRVLSGIAGKSRVFVFRYGRRAQLIAKFDRLDRSEREWGVIETLRHLHPPREVVIPHGRNHLIDGVLIYPAASTASFKESVR